MERRKKRESFSPQVGKLNGMIVLYLGVTTFSNSKFSHKL